jgi:hypothetical protein
MLSTWLTNSALVYEPKCGGGSGCGVSANEYSCAHGAQINFGDLTPRLTYECSSRGARRGTPLAWPPLELPRPLHPFHPLHHLPGKHGLTHVAPFFLDQLMIL